MIVSYYHEIKELPTKKQKHTVEHLRGGLAPQSAFKYVIQEKSYVNTAVHDI